MGGKSKSQPKPSSKKKTDSRKVNSSPSPEKINAAVRNSSSYAYLNFREDKDDTIKVLSTGRVPFFLFLSPDPTELKEEGVPVIAWRDDWAMEPAKGALMRNQLLIFFWDDDEKLVNKQWIKLVPSVKNGDKSVLAENYLNYGMAFSEWNSQSSSDNDFILFRQFVVPNGESPTPGLGKLRGLPSFKLPINAEIDADELEK